MPELRRRALTRRRASLIGFFALILAIVAISGCTETDEQLVEDIGVTRIFLIDSGLLPQDLSTNRIRLQGIEWVLTQAMLDIDGALVDLLAGEERCTIVDTVRVTPVSTDLCAHGIVIESSGDEPFDLKLFLTLDRVEARRAIPIELFDRTSPQFDASPDGDTVPVIGFPGGIYESLCTGDTSMNCRDNCPLVPNDDQASTEGTAGFGSACEFNGSRDSDADQVIDAVDNCIYRPNTDQADTMGFAEQGIPDGIGDACEIINGGLGEQVISIQLTGGMNLNFSDFELVQSELIPSFIVVDFNSQITLQHCDLRSGSCEMNSEEIFVCTTSSPIVALEGCSAR